MPLVPPTRACSLNSDSLVASPSFSVADLMLSVDAREGRLPDVPEHRWGLLFRSLLSCWSCISSVIWCSFVFSRLLLTSKRRQHQWRFVHLIAASSRGCIPLLILLLPLPLSQLPVVHEYYTGMCLFHCNGPIELNYKHRITMHASRRAYLRVMSSGDTEYDRQPEAQGLVVWCY
jgi:hypothetical protein